MGRRGCPLAISGTSARLLAATGHADPNLNFNGTIVSAITFRAWDTTSGSNGGTADASVNGGNTAFSTFADTASITVTGERSTEQCARRWLKPS